MSEFGPLLAARLAWEAEHPRSEVLMRAERAIVRGLVAEGFGPQHQVTRHDRFEIAVDGLLIRVELDDSPSGSALAGAEAPTPDREEEDRDG